MFERQKRLTKDKEFDQVFKKGRSSYDKIIGIKATLNDLPTNRYGIIISNKVSKKAVIRNKIKREIRNILKDKDIDLKTGNDIVVIVLPAIVEADFESIKKSIHYNIKRLRLDKNV